MRKELELLEQAKQAGLPITDQLKAGIGALATEYAKAQVAIEAVTRTQELAAESAEELVAAHEKVARASEQVNQTFASAGKGFLADILAGTDATEALQSALMNLSGQLASMAFDGIFKNLLSGGGASKGGGAGWIGQLLGLADGGMVRGPGSGKSDSVLAMLSNGEYVVNASATAMKRSEPIADGTLQVDRVLQAKAMKSPRGPVDYFKRRLRRVLTKLLNRPVSFFIGCEITNGKFHIHGIFDIAPQEFEVALIAFGMACGLWTGRSATHLSYLPPCQPCARKSAIAFSSCFRNTWPLTQSSPLGQPVCPAISIALTNSSSSVRLRLTANIWAPVLDFSRCRPRCRMIVTGRHSGPQKLCLL